MAGLSSNRGLYDVQMKVDNFDGVMMALRQLDKDGWKRTRARFRTAGKKVSSLANAREPRNAVGGIGVTVKDYGHLPGMRIFARGGSKTGKNAAIFEFAGTRSRGKTPQGKAMIEWLDGYGRPGRFLWAAWDAKSAEVMADVREAWDEAEKLAQSAVDRIGG